MRAEHAAREVEHRKFDEQARMSAARWELLVEIQRLKDNAKAVAVEKK